MTVATYLLAVWIGVMTSPWELIVPAFVFRHDRALAALDRESGIVTA
jgi:hypothetical protein